MVSGHVSTLQETGSDVVIKQDELAQPSDPSQPNRNSSISPTRSIKFQDGQELTTNGQSFARRTPAGQSFARRTPAEVVRGESCGEVLPCSPSSPRVAEVDPPEMPIMVAFDEDEVE